MSDETRYPRKLHLLAGVTVEVEKVWYPTHRDVWRVVYRRDDQVRGCRARIENGRFVELSDEELAALRVRSKA